MRYLSLFSGIEAASVAWEPLGWEAVAFAQFDPKHDYRRGPDFASAVLAHRFPAVRNLGDATRIDEADIAMLGPIDLVVFGSPCQDLSVAGRRAGLEGARSGLFHDAMRIVDYAREHCGCRWALWENVPGAFSSNKGGDFAVVVERMAGVPAGSLDVPPKGWSNEGAAVGEHGLVEWSVLDAQWFGVAQRRRRVFALADFGAWRDRPPVLLEPTRLRGDSAPSRETREGAAGSASAGAGGAGWWDGGAVAATITTKPDDQRMPDKANAQLVVYSITPAAGQGSQLRAAETDVATGISAVTMGKGTDRGVRVVTPLAVRRLTPRECERLQGFPDDWTAIPWRNKPAEQCPDGPRYTGLGNSMAVPVMRWIGNAIEDALLF